MSLSIDPISVSSVSDSPLQVPRTQRCLNCSGSGKVKKLDIFFLVSKNIRRQKKKKLLTNEYEVAFSSGNAAFDQPCSCGAVVMWC